VTRLEQYCPDCKNEVYGSVCKKCGLVLEDRPIYHYQSFHPDFSSYDDENPLRYIDEVEKPHYPDMSYRTYNTGITSNKELRRAFKRNIYGIQGKRYYEGYVEIKRICDTFQLSKNIRNYGVHLFRELLKTDFIKHTQNKFAVLGACLMIACKEYRYPLNFDDVANISTEVRSKIINAYKRILKFKNIKLPQLNLIDYLRFHMNKLNLTFEQRTEAYKLAHRVILYVNISGKKFSGYSGAIIRIISGMNYSNIVNKINVSEPTIYKRIKEIKKKGLVNE